MILLSCDDLILSGTPGHYGISGKTVAFVARRSGAWFAIVGEYVISTATYRAFGKKFTVGNGDTNAWTRFVRACKVVGEHIAKHICDQKQPSVTSPVKGCVWKIGRDVLGSCENIAAMVCCSTFHAVYIPVAHSVKCQMYFGIWYPVVVDRVAC